MQIVQLTQEASLFLSKEEVVSMLKAAKLIRVAVKAEEQPKYFMEQAKFLKSQSIYVKVGKSRLMPITAQQTRMVQGRKPAQVKYDINNLSENKQMLLRAVRQYQYDHGPYGEWARAYEMDDQAIINLVGETCTAAGAIKKVSAALAN